MKSKLKPYLNEIKEKRFSGIKTKDLAEYYGVSSDVMKQFLYRNNINYSYVIKEITNDPLVVNEIVSKYLNGETLHNIGDEFKIGPYRTKKILIDNGVTIRDASHSHNIYSVNESYFDKIDTPNKAYILGLLYSDGNVNTSNGHYTIRLRLQERDIDILKKIKTEMQYTNDLIFYNLNDKNKNWQNSYGLEINNKHMTEQLIKYGVIPNKSLSIKFPDFLDKKLISHFIRGIWDGDGHISTKRYLVCCACNGDFITGLEKIIIDNLNINPSIYKRNTPSGKILNLAITSREKTTKFLDYIYHDAELYMDRKYNYYLDMYYNNSQ